MQTESINSSKNYSDAIILINGGIMKKKRRNPSSALHDYSKYAYVWNGVEIPGSDERYYGIHKDSGRVRIDIKRMKKLGITGIPQSVLDAASAIPRNTTYFIPERIHREDYTVNQFRDKFSELSVLWSEYKTAFKAIRSPSVVAEEVRVERLNLGIDDNEDATVAGLMAGFKRQLVYDRIWVSLCSQFIQQMATELMALMTRKCVSLGFDDKEVSRRTLHAYLNGTGKGRITVKEIGGYEVYEKFFTILNLLKHNSVELFEIVKNRYPDMLISDKFKNGDMSQYFLKINNGFIEQMLTDLVPFYETLCTEFFGENASEAEWNYDDYFTKTINQTIQDQTNPLGV